jgi:two-component system NtrC family sensor kinase
LRNLLQGLGGPTFELELMNHEQEPIYLEVSAQAMHNGSLTPGVHCIARNITERRRLEQQLVQSEKLSAIGQLVAGVAHELNNPLTNVSGYAQLLLRDTTLNESKRLDIEQIHAQAERAARIVQNLLIFAREHRPERSRVDLAEVIRSTLALQNYQLRIENIQVELDIPPDLPATVADPYQLQQVFLNLLTNARQAIVARKQSGTITIRASVVASSASEAGGSDVDSLIQIAFEDNGTGISAPVLKKIFNPFFTTKPVGQGTGLGLSICFGIIKEHNGRIWAESEVGIGTTVFVTLPLVYSEEVVEGDDPLPQLESDGHSYRILVVDDEEPICRLLDRILNDLGHTVLTATDADHALRLIDADPFDLLIIDVKMPGTDGFELFSMIRERSSSYADQAIFMTGDTLSPETLETVERNGSVFLPKPFAIDDLAQVIRQVAQRRSIGSQRAL